MHSNTHTHTHRVWGGVWCVGPRLWRQRRGHSCVVLAAESGSKQNINNSVVLISSVFSLLNTSAGFDIGPEILSSANIHTHTHTHTHTQKHSLFKHRRQLATQRRCVPSELYDCPAYTHKHSHTHIHVLPFLYCIFKVSSCSQRSARVLVGSI